MSPDPDNRGPVRLLEGAAAAVFAIHVVLRLTIRGTEDSWGANLLVHLLVPLAAGSWFAARALERRLEWRLTRLEIPLGGLAILALLSVPGASNQLAAIDGAAGLCAMALLVPLAVHLFGPSRRHTLLALMKASIFAIALYGLIQYFVLGEVAASEQARRTIGASGDLAEELTGRLGAREPSSTLHYPNTFAGFLVLTLPFIFGSLLDTRSRVSIALALLTLGLGAFGLWASGSLGAWMAVAGAAAAFGSLVLLHRRPDWGRALKIGAAALVGLVVLLVIAGPLSPNALSKRSEAIAIRDVYWDASTRIAGAHPFGVGINNFQEHFPEHKDERQEETRHAHNDWLEILVDLGIPGLLALLGIFAVAVWLAPGPDAPPPTPGSDANRNFLALGIPVGVLASWGFQNTFSDDGASAVQALLIAGAWVGAFLVSARRQEAGPFARIGLAAGLAGAAVHFMVDFDFYDPAFRVMFFLVLAALVLSSRPDEPRSAGLVPSAIAAVVCFAIAIPFHLTLVPRLLKSDELKGSAREAGRWDMAVVAWEGATAENPLDSDPFIQLGLHRFEEWKRIIANGITSQNASEEVHKSDLVIVLLDSAQAARPRSFSIAATFAMVHERMGLAVSELRASGLPGMDTAARAAFHFGEAERYARRAVELYPTSARNHYLLGRILASAGRAEGSKTEFLEALRLSAKAVRVRRLALDGAQLAVALNGTQGSEAASAALREWLKRFQGTPGFERRWQGILENLIPAERAVVDAALKSK